MSKVVALALLFVANSIATDKKLAEFPVQGKTPDYEIGVDFLVRSVSGDGQTFVLPDYLVVEIGVYPTHRRGVLVAVSNFHLRLNGKNTPVYAQVAEMVAAGIRYPDWEQRPQLTAGVGPVIIGRPPAVERFPGDPRPGQQRIPRPRVETDPTGGKMPQQEGVSQDEVVLKAALKEVRDCKYPVSGYLYFPYRGKAEKLKSVELVVSTAGEPVVLKLK